MTNAEALKASRARKRKLLGDAEYLRQRAASERFYYHKRRHQLQESK